MNCEHVDAFINTAPTLNLFDCLLINKQNEETNETKNLFSNAEQIFNFICQENQTRSTRNSKLVCKQCIEPLSGQKMCKSSSQLHICASCFFIGCFSLNSSSSSHIKMHSIKVQHFITIDLHYGVVYCFKCNDFQYNEYLESMRQIIFTNSNYLPHSIDQIFLLILNSNMLNKLYFKRNFLNGSLHTKCSEY